jgi:hypothetical protein
VVGDEKVGLGGVTASSDGTAVASDGLVGSLLDPSLALDDGGDDVGSDDEPAADRAAGDDGGGDVGGGPT